MLSKLGINAQSIIDHRLSRVDLSKSKNPQVQDAFANLQALAETIEQHGLIHPISVHVRDKSGYLIEAGERRYLAHVLLGKSEIHAIVRAPHASPSKKLQRQLVENVGRDDLSLHEKVEALIELERLAKEDGKKKLTTKELSSLIGFSERQARKYLTVVHGPEELIALVSEGKLRKLNDVARIAVMESRRARDEAIDALLNPTDQKPNPPVTQDSQHNGDAKVKSDKDQVKRSTKAKPISLGSTASADVIKHMIHKIVGERQFKKDYSTVDWDDEKSATDAWRLFLQAIESKVGGE